MSASPDPKEVVLTGDGGGSLPLPAKGEVVSVIVDGVTIPKSEERGYITPDGEAAVETEDLWMIVKHDGQRRLQRGLCSNHGIWQPGASVVVRLK